MRPYVPLAPGAAGGDAGRLPPAPASLPTPARARPGGESKRNEDRAKRGQKRRNSRRPGGSQRELHQTGRRTQIPNQHGICKTNPDSKRAGAGQKLPCGKTAIVSPRPETVARKKLRILRETGLPVPKRLEPELSSSSSGGRDRRPCFNGSGRTAGGRGRRGRQGLPKRDPRTPKTGPEDSQNVLRGIPGA